MKVEISRPFKIGRVEAVITLSATGQAGDLILEELAAATVRDAVLSFSDAVLRAIPAATYAVALDRDQELDRLREVAEAAAPGKAWIPADLIALSRQHGLFQNILGGPKDSVTKAAAVSFGRLLGHHGRRHLTAKGTSHARRYLFRPCGRAMRQTMSQQNPLPF